MKKCFIFCHGFGFDRSFWKNLLPFFKQYHCVSLDLGYFGNEKKLSFIDDRTVLVGVGHSLGLIKLLELGKNLDYLIGLNAFINFLGNDFNINRRRYQELELMKNSFLKNPYFTLKAFYKRCGLDFSNKFSGLKKEKLEKDLDSLFEIYSLKKDTPILLLGSKNDIVVPVEVVEDNFSSYGNASIQILDHGKHALGFLQAEEVYKRIKSFL